jgi:hypothetical protein
MRISFILLADYLSNGFNFLGFFKSEYFGFIYLFIFLGRLSDESRRRDLLLIFVYFLSKCAHVITFKVADWGEKKFQQIFYQNGGRKPVDWRQVL